MNLMVIMSISGSTIRVMKPELQIDFLQVDSVPQETVMKKIKPADNVLSIKGLALERIKEQISPDVIMDFDQIIVMDDDQSLRDDQMLVDFVFPEYHHLVVHYPKDEIQFRQRKPSFEMEEDCFGCMFGEE